MRFLLRLVSVLGALSLGSGAASALDTVPDQLCLGNPCVITGTHFLADGTTFDFADRDVVIQGIADIGGGGIGVDILAGSLAITSTGQIRGKGGLLIGGGVLGLTVTRDVQINGTLIGGAIVMTGADGGSVAITSLLGAITGTGNIDVSAVTNIGVGGLVDLSAETGINLSGTVAAESLTTGSGAGGGVSITSTGSVAFNRVDVRGGSSGGGAFDVLTSGGITLGTLRAQGVGPLGGTSGGGAATLSAGGAVAVTSIDLSGQTSGGGFLDIDTPDSVLLGTITADGSGVGGGGGGLSVTSGGPITATGALSARGSALGGNGGTLALIAGLIGSSADVTVSGPVQLEGRGGGWGGDFDVIGATVVLANSVTTANLASALAGGAVDAQADTLLRITGTILAGGGTSTSGTVLLKSNDAIELLAPVRANGLGAGARGGLVSAAAGGVLRVATSVSANPGTTVDAGGTLTLSGCAVAIDPGSIIEAREDAGSIFIDSGSTMMLRGSFTAGSAGGQIRLRHGIAATLPNLLGAVFSPAAATLFDPAQKPCASQCGALDSDLDGRGNGCDTCPFTADPGQRDTGGIGATSPPDGIGDACQCGDVTADGRVTLTDSVLISRSLLSPPTALLPQPQLCDVGGGVGCAISDTVVLRRALLVPPTATIVQQCAPAHP